jgi:hypothetical protein
VGKAVVKGFVCDIEEPIQSYSLELIYSTSAIPPKRYDETVKKLYTLRWSSIPSFQSLPTWINPKGRIIRQISYDLRMTSNGVTLEFEAIYDHKVVASTKIAIDYGHCGALVGSSG